MPDAMGHQAQRYLSISAVIRRPRERFFVPSAPRSTREARLRDTSTLSVCTASGGRRERILHGRPSAISASLVAAGCRRDGVQPRRNVATVHAPADRASPRSAWRLLILFDVFPPLRIAGVGGARFRPAAGLSQRSSIDPSASFGRPHREIPRLLTFLRVEHVVPRRLRT